MVNSKTISALLIGLCVGAAAGILLAPHKGSKTRRKILKGGGALLANAKDNASELGVSIKGSLSSIKKQTAVL